MKHLALCMAKCRSGEHIYLKKEKENPQRRKTLQEEEFSLYDVGK